MSPYQWTLAATSGLLFDKSVGLTSSVYDKTENLTTNVKLSKSFITGTDLSFEYKRTSFKGDTNALSTANTRSVGTQDLLGVNLAQDLWANSFGIADRGDTDAASLTYKASAILRTNDLENLVLDSVRAFWTEMGLEPAPVLDPDGKVAEAYGVGLQVTGLPVSVFIARDGTVSGYVPYPLTQDVLDPALKKVL